MAQSLLIFILAFSFEGHAAESAAEAVRLALKAHQDATSYHQWRESIHNPESLVARFRNSGAIDELCKELDKLAPTDLAVFSAAFGHKTEVANCLDSLSLKIENYYSGQSKALALMNAPVEAVTLGPSQNVTAPNENGPSYFHGNLSAGVFALTFDDGPHSSLTEQLLEILANQNVQATFFVVGKNVASHPNIAATTLSRGHTVASHSMNHLELTEQSESVFSYEIAQGFREIVKALPVAVPFFRFPYGARNAQLKEYLRSRDVAQFFWNVDTLDWKITDPTELLEYALTQTDQAGRGIVLFHDIQPQTIAIMPAYLNALQVRAYQTAVFNSNSQISEEDF